ncbi:MAG: PolC-type DNA polymerase III N-terminal domain-containing protein [Lachnospiraceae bacterium]
MKKPFMEVFPTLQLREELKSVLEFASIDRITMNRDRDFMRIYLESDKLIVKSCIFELEQAITGQLFPDAKMTVKSHRAFSSFQAVYAAEPDADL